MSQAQSAVWLEPDRSKPIEIPKCHIVGVRSSDKRVRIKEDDNAVAMCKVDLLKEIRLVEIVTDPKSDMVRDYLRAIDRLRYICLDLAFVEVFKKNPMLFRQLIAKDPDHLRKKIYVGFAGTTVWVEGSTEPMISMAWDAGYEVRSSYTSRLAGNDERAKFVTPIFDGNYWATKDPNRTW